MSTYSRYILYQVSRPMLATIMVALIALLAERTMRVVDLVVGWRGSLLVVVEMLGYLVPHYMGLALPAAFFLGVLLTFARLSREGEMAAIYASGAGLGRLLRPVLLTAALLMVLTTLLASHLQPYGRYAYRAASAALANASFHTLLQGGVFTTLGDTTYMVEGLSADRSELRRVFIYGGNDAGSTVAVTSATGTVERGDGPVAPIVLRLKDGVQQVVPAPPAAGEDPGRRPGEILLRFKDFQTSFGSDVDAMRPRGEDERELTLFELSGVGGQPLPDEIDAEEVAAELHGRLVRIASLPVLPFLAIPLALGRIRGQRSYGLVIGLAALIGYHQVLSFGEALVDDGQIPAWLGLWVPFAAFALVSLRLFLRAATRVPDPRGVPWLDRQVDALVRLARRALGRGGPPAAPQPAE